MRAKLAEAAELLDGAIEAGRLLGTPPALAGNLFNRSVVALAVGDLDIALATAEESVELTRDLDEGFVTAWAAVRLAGVLLETGQPGRAVELLLGRAGGEELTLIPGGWRAYCLELLTRCWLALGPPQRGRARGRSSPRPRPRPCGFPSPPPGPIAPPPPWRSLGDTARAIERALASADAAQEAGAPIEAALSRTLAGRALAQAGRARPGRDGASARGGSARRLRRAALPREARSAS